MENVRWNYYSQADEFENENVFDMNLKVCFLTDVNHKRFKFQWFLNFADAIKNKLSSDFSASFEESVRK